MEFVIAFLNISICLLIVIKFSFSVIGLEVDHFDKYMNWRIVKVHKTIEIEKRKECEDNPLWYLKGYDLCEG